MRKKKSAGVMLFARTAGVLLWSDADFFLCFTSTSVLFHRARRAEDEETGQTGDDLAMATARSGVGNRGAADADRIALAVVGALARAQESGDVKPRWEDRTGQEHGARGHRDGPREDGGRSDERVGL